MLNPSPNTPLTPVSPLALRIAYYAAVAESGEVFANARADVYDRLSATNAVHDARVALDEDNFLKAAIAVDADDEGRWSTPSTLPAVVEFEAVAAPTPPSPLAKRVRLYALALLGDAPAYDGAPDSVTCGAAAAYGVDKLSLREPSGARRVETIISDVCGVSL